MSFFDPSNICCVLNGSWWREPAGVVINGVGIDGRTNLDGKAFVALAGQKHDGHDHLAQAAAAGAKLLIVERLPASIANLGSAGVLLVTSTRAALMTLAGEYRQTLSNAKVIAVTGSVGKTTTRRLIHGVLSQAMQGSQSPKSFNNDIGVPLTLLNVSPHDEFVVVEVGMNAPGEIEALARIVQPDIAVITAVGRCHLEGLGSIDAIAREKAGLLRHMRREGMCVVNADSPQLRPLLPANRRVIFFGRADDAAFRVTDRGAKSNSGLWWFQVNQAARFELAMPGRHNAVNALAAVAIGRELALSDAAISRGLSSVQPADMRLQPTSLGDLIVYNDAYNANPDSVLAALDTFGELTYAAARRIVILGDMLELGAEAAELHREVGRAVIELDRMVPLAHAVFIGPLAAHAAQAAAAMGNRVHSIPALNEDAGRIISDLLRGGDHLLLKASRGAALERLLPMLQPHAGAAA